MFEPIKKLLGKSTVKKIRPLYHGLKGILASCLNGFPSQGLYLIGVNGTKGKTTTTVFLGKILNSLGYKTGYISSSLIFDGEKEFLNPYKMGMLDSFVLQKMLRKMQSFGCRFCILETTSQGLEQHRHWGLKKFDAAMFLNIYPEHIEAHGSFENYQKAKSILPKNLKKGGLYIINSEAEQQKLFEQVLSFIPNLTLKNSWQRLLVDPKTTKIVQDKNSLFLTIEYKDKTYSTRLISEVEVWDLVFALTLLENLKIKIDWVKLGKVIADLHGVPGRMEWVVYQGKQLFNSLKYENLRLDSKISILVDYAHETESMTRLLETLNKWKSREFFDQVIHIISCDGAGRDDWKKSILGKISYDLADLSVFTTDNYDTSDNPEEILNLLQSNLPVGFESKVIREINRFQAFQKATQIGKKLAMQGKKVIVVSTGVGTEKGLTQPNGVMEWDEREKWLEVLV